RDVSVETREAIRERLWPVILAVALGLRPGLGQSTDVAIQPSRAFAGMEVLQLVNGSNSVDLDGNGQPDMVLVGWRENYNAHGSNIFTFYMWYTDEAYERYPERRWYLVPFDDVKWGYYEQSERREQASFTTGQGADC